MRTTPNQARLQELFRYEHGVLYWQKSRGSRTAGARAGRLNSGRMQVRVDGVEYMAYRLIWALVKGNAPQNEIDHIDGNPLNDRIENLREADRQTNNQNQRRAQARNKTGFLGVYVCRGRYVAQITLNGKVRRLGGFDTAQAAHAAYLSAKRELHRGNTL